MRFGLRRRRHRAARPLSLALALVLMGSLYAALSPATQVAADTGMSAQVAEGKALFQVTCSSCHGLNGEGTSQGPSLVGVGAAAVDQLGPYANLLGEAVSSGPYFSSLVGVPTFGDYTAAFMKALQRKYPVSSCAV